MADLTATARCMGYDWAPDGDDPAKVDKAADKHTGVGHATAVTVVTR